ncbi:MAG TPA: hypothetical protein VIZ28_15910 [Chitinophagaceae bacterium]
MDNLNINQSHDGLNFSENLKTQLNGAAVWGGIAAITALISAVLSMVSAFMKKNDPVTEYQLEGFGGATMKAGDGDSIFSVVISLIFSVLFFYFLNRFSTLTKTGLSGNNQEMVSNGLGNLSTYFIIIGVIIILILIIVLVVMAGLLAGAGS